MLGAGEIVLDLEGDGQAARIVVDAGGAGRRPDLADVAIMLGQNELEQIASDPESRMRLIDLRAKPLAGPDTSGRIAELTRRLAQLREELTHVEERLRQRSLLVRDLEQLQEQEREILSTASSDITSQRAMLSAAEGHLMAARSENADLLAAMTDVHSAISSIHDSQTELDRLLAQPASVRLSDTAAIRAVNQQRDLSALTNSLERLADVFGSEQVDVARREQRLRVEIEPIRSRLEASERGLGELTSRIRNLHVQLTELDAQLRVRGELQEHYDSLELERRDLLARQETFREHLFERRRQVAEEVSGHLSGNVVVKVDHFADAGEYAQLLTKHLAGSKLRYNSLAQILTKTILPLELVQYIEHGDLDAIARATNLPLNRVERVAEELDSGDALAELALAGLGDRVDFLLQDAGSIKSVELLSTGQKCAVTLPVLLTEFARTLILDQPEDHLDNAYLVDTIIVALNSRTVNNAQTIIATHNANIPVLGDADQVVALQSDGTHGYVHEMGRFDNPHVVKVITTLMEGGQAAFDRRARFYDRFRA